MYGADALGASLYYLVHSTLIIAALFMLAEIVAAQRGPAGDRLQPAPPVGQPVVLGLLLLLGAVAVTGAPPLSGFVGKLMLLQGVRVSPWWPAIWAMLLGTSLLAVIGMARAGSILFWKVQQDAAPAVRGGMHWKTLAAPGLLFAAGIAMTVFAAPLKDYADAAAAQLTDTATNAAIVLGESARTRRQRAAAPGGEAMSRLLPFPVGSTVMLHVLAPVAAAQPDGASRASPARRALGIALPRGARPPAASTRARAPAYASCGWSESCSTTSCCQRHRRAAGARTDGPPAAGLRATCRSTLNIPTRSRCSPASSP